MKKTNINIWLENELNAFKPPDRLTVSETACRYRELGKNSAITGLYSLNVVPFFGPIMDAGSDPDIDEITVCKPAQIGGTVALVENICFYYTYQEPASIMVSFADEETATYVAKEKLGNMYKDSTAAYHLYDPKKFTNTTITLLNGARIDLAWASSVAKLATKPARIVIADETDKPGYYTKSVEASALSLLSERFRSFPMGFYKFIKLSTPTTDKGNIITSLESSDIIYDWQVPCPHCGQYQILRWSHDYCYGFQDGFFRDINGDQKKIGRVVWDGGRNANRQQIRETCFYECGECGGKWTTEEKNKAVQRGQMVPRTEPIGDERRIGYHINRLYSLFDSGRLDKLLSDWVAIFKLPK